MPFKSSRKSTVAASIRLVKWQRLTLCVWQNRFPAKSRQPAIFSTQNYRQLSALHHLLSKSDASNESYLLTRLWRGVGKWKCQGAFPTVISRTCSSLADHQDNLPQSTPRWFISTCWNKRRRLETISSIRAVSWASRSRRVRQWSN